MVYGAVKIEAILHLYYNLTKQFNKTLAFLFILLYTMNYEANKENWGGYYE